MSRMPTALGAPGVLANLSGFLSPADMATLAQISQAMNAIAGAMPAPPPAPALAATPPILAPQLPPANAAGRNRSAARAGQKLAGQQDNLAAAQQQVMNLVNQFNSVPISQRDAIKTQLTAALKDIRQLNAKLGFKGKVNTGNMVVKCGRVMKVGSSTYGVQTSVAAAGDINCSFCTAAAIARKVTHSPHWTSSTVAQSINQPEGKRDAGKTINSWGVWRQDQSKPVKTTTNSSSTTTTTAAPKTGSWTAAPANAGNQALDEVVHQVEGIKLWCMRTLGIRSIKTIGSVRIMLSCSAAMGEMAQCPSGTVFAVYVDDGAPHWIFAENINGAIQFVDYQTDRIDMADSQPTVSNVPMNPGGVPAGPNCRLLAIALLIGEDAFALGGYRGVKQ